MYNRTFFFNSHITILKSLSYSAASNHLLRTHTWDWFFSRLWRGSQNMSSLGPQAHKMSTVCCKVSSVCKQNIKAWGEAGSLSRHLSPESLSLIRAKTWPLPLWICLSVCLSVAVSLSASLCTCRRLLNDFLSYNNQGQSHTSVILLSAMFAQQQKVAVFFILQFVEKRFLLQKLMLSNRWM